MTTNTRARKAFWVDVRFFIGIALVVISIVGVWLIVTSSRQATPVLQANRVIVEGEALNASDFQVVDVSLGQVAETYLAPQQLVPGLIASRTIDVGELMPLAATVDAASGSSTTIVVESTIGLPAGVTKGTVVELWQAPATDEGRSFDAPRILVSNVVVASVVKSTGMLAQSRAAVELVIDRADVAEVLAAITSGAALSLVPLGFGS